MNIGISVLIPLYNGIEFLEESLQSVLLQTHKKWEIIIGINGHKKDSDVERHANNIVNKYNGNNIYDIRVIYYETKGKPFTLNSMVNDIKYDYIALLDVDDIWFPQKLEKQLPLLYTYDVVGTQCRYFGNMTGIPSIPVGDITMHNFFNSNPVINSSIIIHKDNAKWNDEFLEDYDMWFRLKYEGKTFYNLSEILCKHRIHQQSHFNSVGGNFLGKLKTKWQNIYNDR